MKMNAIDNDTLLLQLTDDDKAWLMMLGLQYLFDNGQGDFKGMEFKAVANAIISNVEQDKNDTN